MRSSRWSPPLIVLVIGMLPIVGCSARGPDDADWVLSPIRFDNTMDGEVPGNSLIDVAYPMELTSDTAGGFWGVSSGSWLHVDAAGAAAQRFNLDLNSPPQGAVAAINPTQLVVVSSDPGSNSLQILDTMTLSWTTLLRDERTIGDVAVSGRDVLFVAYDQSTPANFTIVRISLDAVSPPENVTAPLPALGQVAIDASNDGTIYVATSEGGLVFTADGAPKAEVGVESKNPAVSVNGRGDVLWASDGPPQNLPWFLAGGSSEARQVIERHNECDASILPHPADHITLITSAQTFTMPFLCAPAGFTWISENQFVASVGDEGGAPIVRVSPGS